MTVAANTKCVCGHAEDMHDHRGTCWGWRAQHGGACMSSCKAFVPAALTTDGDQK